MSSQSSQTAANRFFGCLPYLLPIIEVFPFGMVIFQQLPIARELYSILFPLMWLYGIINSITFGSFIFFIILYLGVVQNPAIDRFIRFNTLQSILIGILLSLCGIVLGVLLKVMLITEGSAIHQVIESTIFIVTIAACVYSIVISALGKYTDIPKLSETTHLHLDSIGCRRR